MPARAQLPALLAAALVLALGTLPRPGAAQESSGTRFLSRPDVDAEHIAFVHANDIWVVGRAGGRAFRLTSDEGAETSPALSPDGRWVAFTGEYGGNADVYRVPVTGGQPVRLTWHPGEDDVQGWTPDGRILFRSSRAGAPTRLWQFYTVSPEGGFPEPHPIPQAYLGELSGDGAFVAYQEIGYWDPEWRNYRGGQAQPIRVVSTSDWSLRTPPWQGERQMDPAVMDGVVYYLSERDWAANVWAYDPATGSERQLTFHADFDVKSLGAGGGVVVYEQAGYLHELDPASGRSRRLGIHAQADQNWARARWEEVQGNDLSNPSLSNNGRRALFEYRGEILSLPAENGSWRNLTRSSGVADRYPVWSPDGTQVAWFNDASPARGGGPGEYGLVIADPDGGNARRIEIPDPSFFFRPRWSPDGARIAFTDTDYRVQVVEVASGRVTDVDGELYADPRRSIEPVWSPDGRFLAYARRLESLFRAVFIWDSQTGEVAQVTDGMADALSPAWDAGGKYLYFLASTDFALNSAWLDMSAYDRPTTRALYLVLLSADTPSPFLAEMDEATAAPGVPEGDAPAGRRGAQGGQEGGSELPTVSVDLDGIQARIVHAPGVPARDHQELLTGPPDHVFVVEASAGGGFGGGFGGGSTLHRYSVKDREVATFAERVADAATSANGRHVLYRSGSSWTVAGAAGPPPRNADGRLSLDNLRVRVEPREEWSQMLADGWRFMRDFLYVDNTHGAPWDDVWAWYSGWLPDVEHRSDFNQLLDMLSGEIAVGHSYVRGGDYPDLLNPRTGLLGADLEAVDGHYRITRIYSGENWNPGLQGPLAAPGLGVAEGDFLVEIDGRALRTPTNPFELLEGTAGRAITIAVNARPSLEGARRVTVTPTGNEGQLRSWAWVEGNRRRVAEMSDGRLAYVYLPNTGRGGYSYFNRMYFAQQDRAGAVIDERNNGGGSAADYMVEVMDRELFGYFNSRTPSNRPFTQPMAALWGPKVMIINERAGSGGDLLPYLFRFHEVGPLVGTTTWGGLVHTADTPPLVDGGRFVAPRGAFYDVNGEWAIEGDGVAPDIEVHQDPAAVIAGRDPQLEAAVAEALRLLETRAVELKPEPAPPVRYRRPVRGGGGG
ncbi:MAG: PDZ domain-containing protein [Longimicrobiales bacterium]|nr:PDZ domain-containing protein [Longimicrobiales bacterium]